MKSVTAFKGWFRSVSLVLFLLIILTANIYRFLWLDAVPMGAQMDEISCMVTVRCLATEGVDAQLRPWPLFGTENSAPKPFTYIYPAAAWTKVFGFSVASFRAFMGFCFCLFLVGLFLAARTVFGTEYGLWALLTASVSPWGWNFSRLIYESPMVVVYVVWAVYCLMAARSRPGLVLAGVLFALAMYAYPPVRLQMLLGLIPLLYYRRARFGLTLRDGAAFAAGLAGALLPLVYKISQGGLLGRFQGLSIMSSSWLESNGFAATPLSVLKVFFRNFCLHFDPGYLFVNGDESYVHSTREFGLLGWLDSAGLLLLLVYLRPKFMRNSPPPEDMREIRAWARCLFLGYLCAIIPAALTNEGLPHSLRTIGGMPFLLVLTSLGLWRGAKAMRFIWVAGAAAASVFLVLMLKVYFMEYPRISQGWFSYYTWTHAARCRTEADWLEFMATYRKFDMTYQYYLMKDRHLTCRQARESWLSFNELLRQHGL